jgi:hypothetical protein
LTFAFLCCIFAYQLTIKKKQAMKKITENDNHVDVVGLVLITFIIIAAISITVTAVCMLLSLQ